MCLLLVLVTEKPKKIKNISREKYVTTIIVKK